MTGSMLVVDGGWTIGGSVASDTKKDIK